MAARETANSSENGETVVCPVCGYRNDRGNVRCQGTVIRRGDQKTTCGKDLVGEQPTAAREHQEIHRPGGRDA